MRAMTYTAAIRRITTRTVAIVGVLPCTGPAITATFDEYVSTETQAGALAAVGDRFRAAQMATDRWGDGDR
jgi:hypothetical protein